MPWDGTELRLAELAGDALAGDPVTVAGGPEESVFQPEWSPDGVLHLVSDRTGWWNLYRVGPAGGALEGLAPAEEEFGPPLGLRHVDLRVPARRPDRLHPRPRPHAAPRRPRADGTLADLDLPFTSFYPPHLRAAGDQVACIAGSPTGPPAVVLIDPAGGGVEVLRSSEDEELDPGYLTVPEPIEFPTEGGRTAHALYYPPANRDVQGPAGERPPLVVASHGGPTAGVVSDLHVSYQYFTSRGIAVVDVDYGGSTGYGRAYRQRLDGQWGIVDVDDCVAAARYTWPGGATSTRPAWPSAAAAPAATPPCAPSPSATTSPPGPATTAWPTLPPWPATPTSSSPATWTA